MQLRKLSPSETAQLCGCGLRPHERGHLPTCPQRYLPELQRLRARVRAVEAQLAALRQPLELTEPGVFWRCAACNADARTIARSIRDPDRCIRCAPRPPLLSKGGV